jgi:hypothetical protein
MVKKFNNDGRNRVEGSNDGKNFVRMQEGKTGLKI